MLPLPISRYRVGYDPHKFFAKYPGFGVWVVRVCDKYFRFV